MRRRLRKTHEAGNFEGAEGRGYDPMPSQDLMSGELEAVRYCPENQSAAFRR